MWIVVSAELEMRVPDLATRAIVNLDTESAIERDRCVVVTSDEIHEVELRGSCHGRQSQPGPPYSRVSRDRPQLQRSVQQALLSSGSFVNLAVRNASTSVSLASMTPS